MKLLCCLIVLNLGTLFSTPLFNDNHISTNSCQRVLNWTISCSCIAAFGLKYLSIAVLARFWSRVPVCRSTLTSLCVHCTATKAKRKATKQKEPFTAKMEEALVNAHHFTDYLLSWGKTSTLVPNIALNIVFMLYNDVTTSN